MKSKYYIAEEILSMKEAVFKIVGIQYLVCQTEAGKDLLLYRRKWCIKIGI